jgi:hypothetical protein
VDLFPIMDKMNKGVASAVVRGSAGVLRGGEFRSRKEMAFTPGRGCSTPAGHFHAEVVNVIYFRALIPGRARIPAG